MSAVEQHKKAVSKIINADLSLENARNLWLLSVALHRASREAEAAAYLAMRELEAGQIHSSLDFRAAINAELSVTKNALISIGKLISESG